MRCYCCNRVLSDYESTLKSAISGEYLDTCAKCLEGLGIETTHNPKNVATQYAHNKEDNDEGL